MTETAAIVKEHIEQAYKSQDLGKEAIEKDEQQYEHYQPGCHPGAAGKKSQYRSSLQDAGTGGEHIDIQGKLLEQLEFTCSAPVHTYERKAEKIEKSLGQAPLSKRGQNGDRMAQPPQYPAADPEVHIGNEDS